MSERITVSTSIAIPYDEKFSKESFVNFLGKSFGDVSKIWKDTNPELISFSFREETWYRESESFIDFEFERDLTEKEKIKHQKDLEKRAECSRKAKEAREKKKLLEKQEELKLYEKLKKKYDK